MFFYFIDRSLCVLPFRFFRSCSSGGRTVDAPVPRHLLARTASRGFRLFDWSSDFPSTDQSGHLVLTSSSITQQQFQHQEISTSTSRPTQMPPPGQSTASRNTDHHEDPPDSPLSQDSAYWSQSQPCKSPDYQQEQPFSQEDAASVG